MLARSETVAVYHLQDNFVDWCMAFVAKYYDQDVQVADASLVWLAEQLETNVVFTLDRRDFSTFKIERKNEMQNFRIVPEVGAY